MWKHRRYYWAPELDTRVGSPMIVAWLRRDERSVDVYTTDGEFVREATPQATLTREEIVAANARRRERWVEQNRRLRRVISKSEERYAPTNRPDGLDIVTVSADEPDRDPDLAEPDGELLTELGLVHGLNQPWQPDETRPS